MSRGRSAAAFLVLGALDAALGYGFVQALLASGAASAASRRRSVSRCSMPASSPASPRRFADRAEAARYGGRAALLGSAMLEQLAAFAVSALLMAAYTKFVFDLLCGRSVRWDAQPRDDRGVSWHEAWMRLRGPTLAGGAWLLALPLLPWAVALWSLPLLAGAAGRVPACRVVEPHQPGWTGPRDARLLLTPEESVAAARAARLQPDACSRRRTQPPPFAAAGRLHLAAQAADGD